MGAWDTLFRASPDGVTNPYLAESWKLAPDNSSITFKLRADVEFHQGWGLMTAEDVAWTLNSINGATNPDRIHDNVGDFAANYGLAEVVDGRTVKVEITNFDSGPRGTCSASSGRGWHSAARQSSTNSAKTARETSSSALARSRSLNGSMTHTSP